MCYGLRVFILILILLLPTIASTQNLEVNWIKYFDSTSCGDVFPAVDGGYYALYSTVWWVNDYHLMRLSAIGDSLWSKRFPCEDEEAYGLSPIKGHQNADSTLSVFGISVFNLTIKLNMNLRGVSADSTLIPSGYWIVHTSAEGELLTRNTSGEGIEFVDMATHGNNLDVVVGTKWFTSDSCGVYLLGINSAGDSLWSKTYSLARVTRGSAIASTSDGGYVVAAVHYNEVYQAQNNWLLRIDSEGDTLWTKTFGEAEQHTEVLIETGDGGYLLAGALSDDQLWITKADNEGEILWTEHITTDSSYPEASGIVELEDGGFLIATSSDDRLVKIDSQGNILWTEDFSEYNPCDAIDIKSIRPTEDGGFILCGRFFGVPEEEEGSFVMEVNLNPVSVEYSSQVPISFALSPTYPNPFNATTVIRFDVPRRSHVLLTVHDLLGREVARVADNHYAPGSFSFTWEASQHSSGVYFVRMITDDYRMIRKAVLIK